MKQVDQTILSQIKRSDPASHKGQNGRLLVIAGSEKYHGSLLLSLQAASRIVDMVYVYSVEKNLDLVAKLQQDISVFIPVRESELWETVGLVDTVLIGPGLAETEETFKMKEKLLKDFPEKKVVIDATAMWHLKSDLLHSNCILTPHSREFENVFECHAQAECVQRNAEKYNCTIVLKGKHDYVSSGGELWENRTGNVGMTKGGTGDVLAGVVAALACTHDCLTSALAGIYMSGLAGDSLLERVGTFYNAEDVIEEFGRAWKEQVS